MANLPHMDSLPEEDRIAMEGKKETPTYDRSSELKSFMYAVFRAGGESFGGSGGGYGFPKDQWDEMATAAGLKGASMGDPAAQTYVAAYWMDRLYKQYRNWGLVAVAWKDGAGAAAEIIFQTRTEPAQITMRQIEQLSPASMSWVNDVTNWQIKVEQRGGIPDEYVPTPPKPNTHTVITGGGNVSLDPYNDTLNALREDWEAEDIARQPSGAEMLFAQLESLSNVVSGGTGRKDWRHDVAEVKSGGSIQRLDSMERTGQEQY